MPGEGFTWPHTKHMSLKKTSIEVTGKILNNMRYILPVHKDGVHNHTIVTGKTGAREEALSSCITTTEHVVGVHSLPKWTDVLIKPSTPMPRPIKKYSTIPFPYLNWMIQTVSFSS